MSSEHACVFCPVVFPTLEAVLTHCFLEHRHAAVLIGAISAEFKIYHHTGKARIRCFCGPRFTCRDVERALAPFFREWAALHPMDTNSFAAHLRREGGSLLEHLTRLRNEAMLRKIASAAGDDELALSEHWANSPDRNQVYSESLGRFFGRRLSELQLDKIAPPEVE